MPTTERPRIDDVDPKARQAIRGLGEYVRAGNLDEGLVALVEIRASQVNHCARCLDLHLAGARRAGVDQRRLDVVAAWREAPALFSARERAALAFTEQVTSIGDGGVSDEVWDEVTAVFDEKETVLLLMAIATINVYNRVNVALRTELRPRNAPAD